MLASGYKKNIFRASRVQGFVTFQNHTHIQNLERFMTCATCIKQGFWPSLKHLTLTVAMVTEMAANIGINRENVILDHNLEV